MDSAKTKSFRSRPVTSRDWFLSALTSLVLCAAVWRTLLTGGGLVGGDTYPYFFPQKQVMAHQMADGRLPLWNDRTGLGYPLHAESQAGIFYPPNQLLYRVFSLNTAYNATILLHYFAAFVLTWRFARCQQISQTSALLVATIFVYGWFPARSSLEWSIIGGVWFPTALWMTDRFLEIRSRPRFALLSVCLALHLLAGHFALAFITQLTCLGYAALKTWRNSSGSEAERNRILRSTGLVTLAIGCAMLLAAVQLVPTLELKRLSQREGTGTVFNPGYGHMPPVYVTQIVASWWYWHTPEIVATRGMMKSPWLTIDADTNPVEAHLYFGLIPLGLLGLSANSILRRRLNRATLLVWSLLSAAALIYATGWLMPVTRHLPGFGFFMGPGRYTIVTALGAALIAGMMLDALLLHSARVTRILLSGLIIGLTVPDLQASSSAVRDALPVANAPIDGLRDSWVRAVLTGDRESAPGLPLVSEGTNNVRLLAPGPNVANLYGVSCIPQYLGIGPAEYYADEKTYRTQPDSDDAGPFPSDEELSRLRERGVTHLLATAPIRNPARGLKLLHAAPDSFLNSVWVRGSAPCYLYQFDNAPDRVFVNNTHSPLDWRWLAKSPGDVQFEVSLAGSAVIGLRELMFPGWEVTIDGQPAVPAADTGFARLVDVPAGTHVVRWMYRPKSFLIAASISLFSLISLSCCLRAGKLVRIATDDSVYSPVFEKSGQ